MDLLGRGQVRANPTSIGMLFENSVVNLAERRPQKVGVIVHAARLGLCRRQSKRVPVFHALDVRLQQVCRQKLDHCISMVSL